MVDDNVRRDLTRFPAPLAIGDGELPLDGELPRDVGFLRGGISERLGRRGELWEIAYSAGDANE